MGIFQISKKYSEEEIKNSYVKLGKLNLVMRSLKKKLEKGKENSVYNIKYNDQQKFQEWRCQ